MSDVTTTRRSRIRDLAWYWLPPLIWMGIIFFLSAQPKLPSPPSPWLDMLLKKGAHFGAYGILAFWWWRALSAGAVAGRAALGLAFAVSVLYGLSDEFHQSFVPGRSARLLDALIDAAGAATVLGVLWQRRKGR
ncbi:MAG: VanZ family protein [Anaerolineales bacterium]|nr:MAG: VanZ family protein [Anaerolineales bacterium]